MRGDTKLCGDCSCIDTSTVRSWSTLTIAGWWSLWWSACGTIRYILTHEARKNCVLRSVIRVVVVTLACSGVPITCIKFNCLQCGSGKREMNRISIGRKPEHLCFVVNNVAIEMSATCHPMHVVSGDRVVVPTAIIKCGNCVSAKNGINWS